MNLNFSPHLGISIAYKITQILNVDVSIKLLKEEFSNHPNPNSLLGISDVLSFVGISNVVASFKEEDYFQLPTPFLTKLEYRDGELGYAVVTDISKDSIKFFDFKRKIWKKDKPSVIIQSNHILAMLLQAKENVENFNIRLNNTRERINSVLRVVSVLIFPFLTISYGLFECLKYGSNSFIILLFLLLAYLGGYFSFNLMILQLGETSYLSNKLCSVNTFSDCNAVIESSGSSILGVSCARLFRQKFLIFI